MTPLAWQIRRALPADLQSILAIEQTCPEAPHWSTESWLQALAKDAPAAATRAALVAADPSGILGFAVVLSAGELSELESIAVSPPARRQGIARALLQAAFDWSRQRGAQSMELEVRASSNGALALYRSLGFAEQGRRRAYYQNPAADAILMAVALQKEAPALLPAADDHQITRGAKV